ncbi:hypothetical protein GCM10011516_16640 [Sphingobacterium cellulitidis]|nr:hypothetical protein GCM10011516_16640 [Sphingobacterium soli]
MTYAFVNKYFMSLLFRFLLVLSPAFIFAQGHEKEIDCVNNIKLYKSYEDYSKGKVLDSACLSKQGNELEKYWGRIVLKKEKEKKKYNHGSLWGYQIGETLYRYSDDGKTFKIVYGYPELVDSDGLFIYIFREGYNYGIRGTYKIHYQYSKDLESPIKELTISNLAKDIQNADFIADVKAIVEDLSKNKSSTIKQNAITEFNTKYRTHFPKK